jgi:hypothetical protein
MENSSVAGDPRAVLAKTGPREHLTGQPNIKFQFLHLPDGVKLPTSQGFCKD